MSGGPWVAVAPLPEPDLRRVRSAMIFDHHKWDPQVADTSVLCPFPLVLRASHWRAIARWAGDLTREALAAERELLAAGRPWRELALPRSVRRALPRGCDPQRVPAGPRLMRFDFHFTSAGWRISECNSDVPGGFIEASAFPRLMARHVPWAAPAGDPAGALAEGVAERVPRGGRVALVHATAYTDDRQVMVCLAEALEKRGLVPALVAPDHLDWIGGAARVAAAGGWEPADLVLRFFPAEWLPNLPRRCGWEHFFRDSITPQCNPGAAILIQTKRFPLVWPRLATRLPTWAQLLPPTRDPRAPECAGDTHWVLKPALGRVGEMIGLRGVIPDRDWHAIARLARRWPRAWVAQEPFTVVPIGTARGRLYPCLGVYTLDGTAIGAYGRLAERPLIDQNAFEAAVLVAPDDARDGAVRSPDEGG